MDDNNSEEVIEFLKNNIYISILTILSTAFFLYMLFNSKLLSVLGKTLTSPLVLIICGVLSFSGAKLADKIRLAVMPDSVFTSGFWGLVKEKIFWGYIPQLIGAVIGGGIGIMLINFFIKIY